MADRLAAGAMQRIKQLPAMTDPMGQSWRQPKDLHKRVRVVGAHIEITREDFLRLPNYSATWPSGVYAGKAWRCECPDGVWLVCWYYGYGVDQVAVDARTARIVWLPPTLNDATGEQA